LLLYLFLHPPRWGLLCASAPPAPVRALACAAAPTVPLPAPVRSLPRAAVRSPRAVPASARGEAGVAPSSRLGRGVGREGWPFFKLSRTSGPPPHPPAPRRRFARDLPFDHGLTEKTSQGRGAPLNHLQCCRAASCLALFFADWLVAGIRPLLRLRWGDRARREEPIRTNRRGTGLDGSHFAYRSRFSALACT
jgi:hypothetical protein